LLTLSLHFITRKAIKSSTNFLPKTLKNKLKCSITAN